MTKYFLILTTLLILTPLRGQDHTVIDSLKSIIKYEESDLEKMKAYESLIKYYQRIDLDQSMIISNEAFKLAEENENDTALAKLWYFRANSQFMMGDFNNALKSAHNSLSIYERNKHALGTFKTLNTIGSVYDRLSDYKKAMDYYFKAIQTVNKIQKEFPGVETHKTILYNNIACSYLQLDSIAQAKQYFMKGIDIAQKKNDRNGLANIYNNLGKNSRLFESDKDARNYLDMAIEIRQNSGDWNGLSKSYYYLSNYFFNQNELDSAEWAASKSIAIASKVGALESQCYAFRALFNAYHKNQQFEKAVEAHINYKALSDSLLNSKKISEISQTRVKYELEEYEQEMLIEKQKIQLRNTLIISGLVILFLVSMIMLVIYRLQKNKMIRQNEKLEQEIEEKNKELTTNVMYMVRKNELITQIAKRLFKLKENVKMADQPILHNIIVDLQSEVDKEVWQEFEYRFQQVHTSFYQNLLQKHPDLTPAEQRLCALLKLNMTSKEIAAITHQGLKSIEVSRARLRKKINITGKDTMLVSYLEQF